jgi:ABC-2 type transport system permease protein
VRPAADPVLRLPVLALIDQQRLWIAGWALGLAALAAFFTSLTRTIVDTLDRSDIPMMRIYFQRLGVSAYSDFLGAMWFGSALFLISAFVVVQVNGWSADDGEGRLEAILTAPVSRGRVVIERLAALLVAVGIIEAVTSLVVYWSAQRNEIVVAGERLALASLLVLPVAFAFGGIGHALVGWRPRVAVVALSTLAVVSYFTQQFAPLFDWPDWIRNTSLYALYGMPLKEVDWPGIGGLVAIGAAGTAGAVVAMRRRDVGG